MKRKFSKNQLWVIVFVCMALGIFCGNYVGAGSKPALVCGGSFVCLVLLISCVAYLVKGRFGNCPYKNALFDILILLFFFLLGFLLISPYADKEKTYHAPKHEAGSIEDGISNKLSNIFHENISIENANLLDSVLLGRRGISYATKRTFRDAGTAHLLAISGMHVVVVASVFLVVLSFLRIPHNLKLIIVSLIVLAYSMLCFNKAPVLRASIMFFIFSLFSVMQRPFLNFHTLAIAGIISLFINPVSLFTISFQLSFVAVLFIMIGFKFFWPKRKFSYLQNGILICFVVSFWAIIGTLPLISFYFGKIYLLSWISGTLTSPLLAFVIYGAFLYLALFYFPFLSGFVAVALDNLISLFIKINHAFSQMLYMSIELRFNLVHVCMYYLLCAVVLIYFYNKKCKKLKLFSQNATLGPKIEQSGHSQN